MIRTILNLRTVHNLFHEMTFYIRATVVGREFEVGEGAIFGEYHLM